MPFSNISELPFYGNPIRVWFIAMAILAITLSVLVILRALVMRRLASFAKHTRTEIDDLAVDLLRRTNYFFLFLLALLAGSFVLTLPAPVSAGIHTLTVIGFLVQSALWGNAIVTFWLRRWAARQEMDGSAQMLMAAIGFVTRLVLWALIVVLVLDNLGVHITALVTGLGIGGVAVALAVQNVLGDLFAALSIVLDRPFVVGDPIDVGGDFVGSVQHIGLKSTRIRSVSGEMIVIANGDLLKSRIRNFRGQVERRVLFRIGIDRNASPEELARVPTLLREVIEAQSGTRFDRAHFKNIGDLAFEFEVVYFMTDPNYTRYMDAQQAINLELLRRLNAERIELTHPGRPIIIAPDRESQRETRPVRVT